MTWAPWRSNWVGSTPNRTFRFIREECGCEFLWCKPCGEQHSPSLPVIHPRHPWAPIHGISLMRVEMSAMIHSERRRETGHCTKSFYEACLVFPPHLYSSRFVTWLEDPLTHSQMWKRAQFAWGLFLAKPNWPALFVVWWSGVLPWNVTGTGLGIGIVANYLGIQTSICQNLFVKSEGLYSMHYGIVKLP